MTDIRSKRLSIPRPTGFAGLAVMATSMAFAGAATALFPEDRHLVSLIPTYTAYALGFALALVSITTKTHRSTT